MSGSEASAESRRSNAENAQIRHLSRSATTFFAPISPGNRPVIRPISPPGSIPCYQTRHAGSSLLISTRSPGSRTLPHSAIRRGQKASPLPSNDRARAMVLMHGSSSAEPVAAADARRLGALLITATMDRCPDIGFDSYDRFFPSQDTMPAGGFGNLIALPFQSRPRENGNSVFVDDDFRPYDDQWAYLSEIGRLSRTETAVARGRSCHCGTDLWRAASVDGRGRRAVGRTPRPAAARNHRSRAHFPNSSRSCWAIRSTSTGRSSRQSW